MYEICIHGAVDGFSRKLIWLKAGLSNNDPRYIGGINITDYLLRMQSRSETIGHLQNKKVCSTVSDWPNVLLAAYFLEAIKVYGGCPAKVRADCGTENGHMEQMQMFLRQKDPSTRSECFLYGKSTANQRIEWGWGMLRRECLQFWMNLFSSLEDKGVFEGNKLDKMLIQYCFMPAIQVYVHIRQLLMLWLSHARRKYISK